MLDLTKIKELIKMTKLTLQEKLNGETCEFKEMSARYWNLTDTLMGGNDIIRSQGTVYLPKFHDESVSTYKTRLSRSYLFPAYSDTIDRHAGKPFSRPVIVSETNNAQLDSISEDANLEGQDLTSLSKGLFKDSENHGLGYILVDMPSEGGDGSVSGDQDANIRPKFIHIPAPCLCYWEDAVINNSRQLTEIVYKDEKKRYRWTMDTWEVYKEANEDECRLLAEAYGTRYLKVDKYWTLESEGVNELKRIPLIVNYFNRLNWMSAKPSLLNLAEQNLKYYQEQSDQDSILRFARTGVYVAKGMSGDEADQISIGANKVIEISDPSGSFEVVEYSGTSINAGQASLDKLKTEMELTGLKPELKTSVDSTATGVVVNEASVNSDLKVWACVIESSLTKAYELAAEWLGVELPEDFKVSVYKDFSVAGSIADMDVIMRMKELGILSPETVIKEAQIRSIIDGAIDPEEEKEKVEGSTPVFPGTGGF